jgi:hypothetical protein
MSTTNGDLSAKTQAALVVAYDAMAYLTILLATIGIGGPGIEYGEGVWLHLQSFIERAEHLLLKVDPEAALKLRAKICENADFLQESIIRNKAKEIL